MKKQLTLIAALVGIGASSAFAYDGQVTFLGHDGLNLGNGSGGAFRLNLDSQTSGGPVKTGYSIPGSVSTGAGKFLAFCVEKSETIGGGQYNFNVNTAAVEGGGGAVSGSDPLSIQTQYLFRQFVDGQLDDLTGPSPKFTYDNTGGNALQEAIWFLEEEISSAGAGQYLVDLAIANAQNIEYGVRVLNVYTLNGDRAQDMLVVVPEPSTYIAGGLALLPLLFGLRSRLSRK